MGYRRVFVVLDREGWEVSIKIVYNVYRALGLQLRNRTPKRRVRAKLRDDRAEATGPNDVWAMDYVHDQLALGRKLRILTIVDTHSRYCPATDARFQYRGEDVVQTLERICSKVGYPKTIRVDNGSEFISRDLDLWAYAKNVTLDFSRPGKPTDNGFILRGGNSPPDCFLIPPHIQQQAEIRMPERPLVHEPRGRRRKAGGLAQTLQR
jgi:putative transposase